MCFLKIIFRVNSLIFLAIVSLPVCDKDVKLHLHLEVQFACGHDENVDSLVNTDLCWRRVEPPDYRSGQTEMKWRVGQSDAKCSSSPEHSSFLPQIFISLLSLSHKRGQDNPQKTLYGRSLGPHLKILSVDLDLNSEIGSKMISSRVAIIILILFYVFSAKNTLLM